MTSLFSSGLGGAISATTVTAHHPGYTAVPVSVPVLRSIAQSWLPAQRRCESSASAHPSLNQMLHYVAGSTACELVALANAEQSTTDGARFFCTPTRDAGQRRSLCIRGQLFRCWPIFSASPCRLETVRSALRSFAAFWAIIVKISQTLWEGASSMHCMQFRAKCPLQQHVPQALQPKSPKSDSPLFQADLPARSCQRVL